jgi:hypothetical protein
MNKHEFTAAAAGAFARFGTTAHKAIEAYRQGGDKIGEFATQRWDTAFEQSRSQLDAATRKNAKHARDVFSSYYARGVALTADGAGIAVDTFVGAAIAGIERLGTYKHA